MEIKGELRILSWYQIAGGVLGFGLTIWLILQNELLNSSTVMILVGALMLYTFSMLSGLVLLRSSKLGIKLAIINQLFQILSFSLFGYAYQYSSGIYLALGIDLTQVLEFKFNLSFSSFNFTYNEEGEEVLLLFNVVPILIVGLLNRLNHDLEEEQLGKSAKKENVAV